MHAASLIPILGLVQAEPGREHLAQACKHAGLRRARAVEGGVVQNFPELSLSKLTRDCSMYCWSVLSMGAAHCPRVIPE